MSSRTVLAAIAFAAFFAGLWPGVAGAQEAEPASDAATAGQEAADDAAAEPGFSDEQLEQMLAPVALYPDSLLIQLLMASTYPLEVIEADRWRKKNSSLEGDALDKALESEDWDPAVKAMTLFPDLLGRMSENLDWMQDLGDAFLAQQVEVLDTVQALRKQAYDAGNLQSGEQQTVVVEKETQVIEIEPAQPEVVYVPQYDSAAVYGTQPPANNYYPSVNTYSGTDMLMTGALSFGAGLLIGNLIWDDDSDCDWDDHRVYRRDVDIDIDGDVNIGNRANVGRGRQPWQHNPDHRRGVRYRDTKTRQTYANRAGSRPALDKNAALGHSRGTLGSGGGGGKAAGGPSRSSASPTRRPSTAAKAPVAAKKPAAAPRVASAAKKPAPAVQKRPSPLGSAGGNRPTAVGGLGGGAATRAASARGASSRGIGGGGKKSPGKLGAGGGKRR